VLAIALGIAYGSAMLFSVSFALGAFFAGMVLSESSLSHRAAEDLLPLKDAFAVLFFVSVGMLFDPAILIEQPWAVAAVVAIIVVGKSVAAFGLVLAFGYPRRTALTVSVSLAQIGEFSFILAGLGIGLGIMPAEGQALILAGALLSITANPFLFALVTRYTDRPTQAPVHTEPEVEPAFDLEGHAVIVGHGRVGTQVAESLSHGGVPVVVVDLQRERADVLRSTGGNVVYGNATEPGVLRRTGVDKASILLVAVPDGLEAGSIIEHARQINPDIHVVARAQSPEAEAHLHRGGADTVIIGEREIARRMVEEANREAKPFSSLQPSSESAEVS
jgi:CPA2 family monovalent cation:H+ antiporter-2